MRISSRVLIFLSFVLLATACGSDKKGQKKTNPDDSVSDPYIQSLLGSWTRTCTQGQKIAASFAPSSVDMKVDAFLDGDCSKPFVSAKTTAQYQAGASQESLSNAKSLSFQFGGVSLTPLVSDAANLMNQGKVCGYNDWKVGESKSIKVDAANCANADLAEFKALQNQIFQVDGNVLNIYKANGSSASPGYTLSR